MLIALLLPAVKEARHAARVVNCASNLRQIVAGIRIYANDNTNMLPAYRHLGDPNGLDSPSTDPSVWTNWTQLMVGGSDDSVKTNNPGKRKLQPYVYPEGFECPSDVGPSLTPYYYGAPNHNQYDWWGSSYLYNSNWWSPLVNGTRWVLWGKRYDEVKDQSTFVAIADTTIFYTWPAYVNQPSGPHATDTFWHDPPRKHPGAALPQLPQPYHMYYDPLCNVAFLDGHAAFIRLGPFEAGDQTLNRPHVVIDPTY